MKHVRVRVYIHIGIRGFLSPSFNPSLSPQLTPEYDVCKRMRKSAPPSPPPAPSTALSLHGRLPLSLLLAFSGGLITAERPPRVR